MTISGQAMVLTWRTTDDRTRSGTVVFDADPARVYQFIVSVCSNPICECGEVRLQVQPDDGAKEEAWKFTVGLEIFERKVKEPEPESDVARKFTEAFVNGLTNEDWEQFDRIYRKFKQDCTEAADLTSLSIEFSPDAMQLPVPYLQVLPYARQLGFIYQGLEWRLDDLYCVAPNCGCHAPTLGFERVKKPGETQQEKEPLAGVEYNYVTGAVKVLTTSNLLTSPLFEAFKESKADLNAFLAKRHADVRLMFHHFLLRETMFSEPEMVGRNDPCPCGSGKKYKKCCGQYR